MTFARLIYESAPQTQGLLCNLSTLEHTPDGTASSRHAAEPDAVPAALPSEADCYQFADAYFETYQPLYPFINEDAFHALMETVRSETAETGNAQKSVPSRRGRKLHVEMAQVQVVFVLSIGARILERKLSTESSSNGLLATAMQHIARIPLHDSVEGIQILLLLVLNSFLSPTGHNACFFCIRSLPVSRSGASKKRSRSVRLFF